MAVFKFRDQVLVLGEKTLKSALKLSQDPNVTVRERIDLYRLILGAGGLVSVALEGEIKENLARLDSELRGSCQDVQGMGLLKNIFGD